MTFLELVNQLREETGASGPALTTLGGALSRESTRYKNWIIRAWKSIQTMHRGWLFMKSQFSFQTTAGVQSYTAASLSTPLTSFANWDIKTFRAYNTAVGVSDEQILGFLDYDTFRNLYQFGVMSTTQQRPVVFTVDPAKNILLGPIPDTAYTIRGEYYRAPQTLVADSDTPTGIDDEFHEAIVFHAMRKYAYFESSPEVLARANEEADKLISLLEADELPAITMGPALA